VGLKIEADGTETHILRLYLTRQENESDYPIINAIQKSGAFKDEHPVISKINSFLMRFINIK
jgi:hypothetical protein